MAQDTLDATASNPVTMGWMQGFPPAEDKQIRFTDPDYFAFPKLRWTVCHFRELMPTVAVNNGNGGVSALPESLDPGLDEVTFTPLGSDLERSLRRQLHRWHSGAPQGAHRL